MTVIPQIQGFCQINGKSWCFMILGAVSSVIRSQPRDRSTLKMISELFTVVLPISGIVFSLALAIMMRSTKDYPKNFAHLKSEMIYQWLGIVGVADDIMSRKRNQIGETTGLLYWIYLLVSV